MKQNIVVVKIPITISGELKFFQINLPRDISRIVGIETSIMGLEGIYQVSERYVAGVVKVQAENIADQCYSSEVAIGNGAFEKTITGFNTNDQALLNLFAAPAADRGMHKLLIKNSFTLYGCYEDLLIKQFGPGISYTIRLYLWTETDEPNKKEV